jgi:glycosyltransferase involved in cell wall biosynthesis
MDLVPSRACARDQEAIEVGDEPRISVIMPTLNCADWIADAVVSVVGQTLTAWELLVMDAGSTDGTAEIVQGFGDERIKLHQEPDDGVAHAWDKALLRARGDHVMFLCGNDAYVHRDWLRVCAELMRTDPTISLVWGVPSIFSGGAYVGVAEWPWGGYAAHPKEIEQVQKDRWLNYWLSSGAYFPDNNMCVRRNVLRDCMPRYRVGTRVMDKLFTFYYNFVSRGYLPYGVPQIVSLWRHEDNQLSESRAGERRLIMMDYLRRVRRYRAQLLEDQVRHVFVDGAGQPVSVVPPLKGRMTEADFYIKPRGATEPVDATRHVEHLMAST